MTTVIGARSGWCLLAQIEGERNWESVGEERDALQIEGGVSRYLHGVEFAIFSMVLAHSRAHPTTTSEQIFSILVMIL